LIPKEDVCVVELKAKSPLDGHAPTTIGSVSLSEMDLGAMTSVAPWNGQGDALSAAMETAHGVGFPAPGQALFSGDVRAVWFGRGMALLTGVAPDAGLSEHAALTDQSDAWAAVRLDGAGAEDVLARLVPVDLRAAQFGPGATARTELAHMAASVTRLEDGAFLVMVFRSMAQTLLHDLKSAMEAVAARG
jgi:sarcosine oxidase subunit gamma